MSTCPTCGGALEQTFGGEGGCMFCLLQAGIGSEEETMHDSNPEAPEGSMRFGVYEIDCHADDSLCELGRGAMGVTYRATDTSLQRKVALKIIKTDIAERSADARERFVREARAAAAFRHEHIATVYQFGMRLETGQYFYAMELIEGETLDDRVRRAGPLDARTTIGIAEQVTSALAAAEKHGLVHRDLKPANLMLVNPDDPEVTGSNQARSKRNRLRALRKSGIPVVKIIDFGLAKAFHSATDLKSLTHDRFVGTPAFASPEQFEHSALDVRSDIYSLGETLWFALTGKTPFAGHTLSEIHRAQKSNVLPTEQLKAAHVPHGLRSLLGSMLAFEPASRPGTVELATRLQRSSPDIRRGRRRRGAIAAAFIVLGICTLFFAYRPRVQNAALNAAPDKSIAVLPFENRSEDKANAYFADGIQDEILTRLSKIADLKVISRTSTQHYKSAPENLREIARELGVAHIVEGSVQKSGDAVRVNVQLINAATDSHVWADTFDRKLTDIFSVESEVSQKIAAALQANLSPNESHVLAAVRTPDTEAYDLFLRGEYEFRQAQRGNESAETYDRADAFYRQALARDPNFAEAAAEFARSRLSRHWFVSSLEPAKLEEVKSLIDRALALAPNSPEAHLALGLFFYCHRQYQMALTEFNRTLELQPNSASARIYCASIHRRRGEWERSLAASQRAQELDPRDVQIPQNIGATYVALRQWKDAERAELRALAIDPRNGWAALSLLISRLNATGDVGSARRALDGFPEAAESFTLVSRRGPTGIGNVAPLIGMRIYLDVMERRFPRAFQAFDKEVVNEDLGRLQQVAGRAALRLLAGETDAAKSAGEEARPSLEARLRERPDDTFAMTELSWVYLALRRNVDALRLSKQAADTISIEKDAFSGPNFQIGLAQIEARSGAPEEAIKRLRRLLSIPAGWEVSIARLKIDPVWDPIRNRPDFQKLLSGPEQIGPNK
jgi:TolB-like protein/Tfp pilus assembly protein PilF/tRNA A-37 threonylcarbamoyl transferase component Bud32